MTKYIYAKYKEIALGNSESEEFKYDPSYRYGLMCGLKLLPLLFRHGPLWASFNPDRHHVMENIGEVANRNDGETVCEFNDADVSTLIPF